MHNFGDGQNYQPRAIVVARLSIIYIDYTCLRLLSTLYFALGHFAGGVYAVDSSIAMFGETEFVSNTAREGGKYVVGVARACICVHLAYVRVLTVA